MSGADIELDEERIAHISTGYQLALGDLGGASTSLGLCAWRLESQRLERVRDDRRAVSRRGGGDYGQGASFHTAGVPKKKGPVWEAKGLGLYYLPSYCAHLKLIEGVWRRLKGFLLPRRFYDSVAELKGAVVLRAPRLLGAVEVHYQLADT